MFECAVEQVSGAPETRFPVGSPIREASSLGNEIRMENSIFLEANPLTALTENQ